MKALILGGILAVGLSAGPPALATAEAGHRHSRHCGHRSGYSSSPRYYPAPVPYGYGNSHRYGNGYGYEYGNRSPYYNSYPNYGGYGGYYGHRHSSGCGHYGSGYGSGYGPGYGYGSGYGYGYAPPSYVVVPPPPFRCVRPRVSIHLGF